MLERIICRFRNEEDLQEFATRNGFTLTNDVKEFDIHTHEFKVKKKVKSTKQKSEDWKLEWFDMPEYTCEKVEAHAQIDFLFKKEDLELARKILDQSISEKTKSVWYPKLIPGSHSKLRVVCGSSEKKYPIYVVSKGRSEKCYTSRFLTQMEVEHFVVCEPQELKSYVEHVQNKYATVLELDMSYKDNYDTFDTLGDTKSKGPGGARNFCWEHSMKNGHAWHWVFDDNANEGFHYFTNNKKHKCRTGAWFRAIENFVDRYDNIAIAGLNYTMFCIMGEKYPAFITNTRIYSFLLIRNDIPYRWRGRYNEDTDLSLRVLKDNWCTVQFNAFTGGKATTQKIGGGNTEEFYSHEGTLPKSKMLEDMHPDVAKVVWKFNRWHHEVSYSSFKQKLILKQGIERDYKINNYGMKIINTDEESTSDTKSYLEEKYKHLINDETNYKEINVKEEDKNVNEIELYVKGENNGKYAVIILYKGKTKEFNGCYNGMSKNTMDLAGCIIGLKHMKNITNIPIKIIMDSQYVIDGNNICIDKIAANDWKNSKGEIIENQKLWEELCRLKSSFKNIIFKKYDENSNKDIIKRLDFLLC